MNIGRLVEPQNINIAFGKDMAIITNFEKCSNVDSEGNPVTISIRATNTYRIENGEWKMVGHHTDLLPFCWRNLPNKSQ